MSKAFDNWWATYPDHWMKPGVEQVAGLAWNAAIEAAAKMLELKSCDGPQYAKAAVMVRALANEVK